MEIFILRDGQQTGPFTEDTVQSLFQRGSLTPADMAWCKGLPAWMPLGEVLNPGSEKPSLPPPSPTQSGIRQGPLRRGASAKQKALLKYIGATFSEEILREEAALLISDAMENPKLTSRLQKWTEEKLKLHPELFQEELDQRRAHRVLRYLERCQTEAAEVVKDVTKAHVQVLVESLDKKNPTWENDQRAALWENLLPAIGEHFPQLVYEKWRERLKSGGVSKVAESMTEGEPPVPPEAPNALSAALRGLVYGALVLVIFFGARQWLNHDAAKAKAGTANAGKNPPPAATAPGDGSAAGNEAGAAPGTPAHPTTAPLIAANPVEEPAPAPNAEASATLPPDATPAANPATPAATAGTPAVTPPADPTVAANPPAATAPAPDATPATPPGPVNPSTNLGTPPAPPPPGADTPATTPATAPPTPGTPDATATAPGATANSGFKSILTIVRPVAVQLQFGKVTLNTGTRVRFISLEGPNVRVNFNNNVILVPGIATDVDPSAVPPAPAIPALPTPAAATPPAVALPAIPAAPKPATPGKPSSDL